MILGRGKKIGGFTMVEICVVMAILGLLAMLVWADFPKLVKTRKSQADERASSALISAAKENAVLLDRPIILETKERRLTFFPNGTIEETKARVEN
jgi:prepilin-type N-terminal cleavage/methylation domain-containing protein